jgi:flagellum-specific ATP synthase
MKAVSSPEHSKNANKLREIIAVYKDAEDLINIGAYKAGANPKIDKAIKLIDPINAFLKQSTEDHSTMEQCLRQLQSITSGM